MTTNKNKTNMTTEIKNANDFRDLYQKAKTLGDLENLTDRLEIEQAKTLFNALWTVKQFDGIDMRQECLLTNLKFKLHYNGMEQYKEVI